MTDCGSARPLDSAHEAHGCALTWHLLGMLERYVRRTLHCCDAIALMRSVLPETVPNQPRWSLLWGAPEKHVLPLQSLALSPFPV